MLNRVTDSHAIAREIERRRTLWHRVLELPEISPDAIRRLGLFAGQAGIYRDLANTKSSLPGDGIALSFLHTGASYDDDLSSDGLLHHYPSTNRRGRHDDAEIASGRAAFEFAVPVFVIIGNAARNREVRLGYVQDFDDAACVFLVGFVDDVLVAEPNLSADFQLFGTVEDPSVAMVRKRPNQQRFKFEVLRRYGASCAVCDIRVQALISAAHLVPKKAKGSDDAQNGLALCANHHMALDLGLWRISPDSMTLVAAEGVTLGKLQISRTNLSHLPERPHADSVTWLWNRGFKRI